MKIRYNSPKRPGALWRLLTLVALGCAYGAAVLAQQTAGGTQISNTATASYDDGSGNTYNTTSLPVVVTVANVAGLAITPDGGGGSVVAGNTNASVVFTVTNTGNFSDTVTFQANGASLIVGGAISLANVTQAFVDVNGDNTFNGADVNILTNPAAVTSAAVAANGSIAVVVKYGVPSNASGSVTIQLGDTPGAGNGDNAVANLSANEVRNTTAGVNGRSEGRGNYSVTVQTDATLQTYLTAPAGPIAAGSDITYTSMHTCNTGTQTANSITLTNAPVGSKTGIFEIVPIPLQTALAAGQTFPAGTLYSNDALTVSPITATWTTAPAGALNLVKRIAFNRGATLAASGCTSDISYKVTIDVAANANIPVLAIVDSFALNSFSAQITDQSGDTVAGAGNGRADLSPAGSLPDGSNLSQPGNIDGDGVLLVTLIARLGAVLNGPSGQPGATGPTNTTNDDFTNKSVNTGIAGIPPGSNTNASGVVTFTNTVQNTGNADDIFTLSVPNYASLPSGTVLVITTPNGTVTVNAGNAAGSVAINVARGATANYTVQMTLPTNQPVLAGYDAQLRAVSANTPASNNLTIDRIWTGFVRLVKTTPAQIINGTGNGGPTDPVPGAVIVYQIAYTNVTGGNGSGSGNGLLTASNIVISENGGAGTNNWATNTTMALVPAPSDTNGGTITDGTTSGAVTAATNFLKDTVATLAPGATGTFSFRRTIK
ncbi:MAG: hypothetical protein QOF02_3379 [Blastocatellia bacterium]|jgi:hypothetical protein|nr:hypothetical protein [Blastocatellia bacterium]